MFGSPLYFVIIVPALILTIFASWRVRSAYNKYSKITSSSGLTAQQVAQRILEYGATSLGKPELRNVKIESVSGKLSDHYDPRSKVLRLSNSESRSIADIGVAAHEAGHALQDVAGYQFLAIRSALVPPTQFGSQLLPIMGAGLFFAWFAAPLLMRPLLLVIIIAYALIAIFAIVTLPVELDASSRAKRLLRNTGSISSEKELAAVNTVLDAAALTYVAAAVSAIMSLLYYVLMFLGSRR
ncbi:zinc metallopeptidase [Candidatus Acetothermia bacterium]|nr:zinc metallopeptidase [Candidatus Acetothermia bacterium]MBI3643909.1 zinc metallopeptidase [Candidatus Acetothermia bacterium]